MWCSVWTGVTCREEGVCSNLLQSGLRNGITEMLALFQLCAAQQVDKRMLNGPAQ